METDGFAEGMEVEEEEEVVGGADVEAQTELLHIIQCCAHHRCGALARPHCRTEACSSL